jgi:hypothetical protein
MDAEYVNINPIREEGCVLGRGLLDQTQGELRTASLTTQLTPLDRVG